MILHLCLFIYYYIILYSFTKSLFKIISNIIKLLLPSFITIKLIKLIVSHIYIFLRYDQICLIVKSKLVKYFDVYYSVTLKN